MLGALSRAFDAAMQYYCKPDMLLQWNSTKKLGLVFINIFIQQVEFWMHAVSVAVIHCDFAERKLSIRIISMQCTQFYDGRTLSKCIMCFV